VVALTLTYSICVLSVDFTLIPSNLSLPSGLENGSFPHLGGAILAFFFFFFF